MLLPHLIAPSVTVCPLAHLLPIPRPGKSFAPLFVALLTHCGGGMSAWHVFCSLWRADRLSCGKKRMHMLLTGRSSLWLVDAPPPSRSVSRRPNAGRCWPGNGPRPYAPGWPDGAALFCWSLIGWPMLTPAVPRCNTLWHTAEYVSVTPLYVPHSHRLLCPALQPDQPYPLYSGAPFTSLERARQEACKLARHGYGGWMMRVRETQQAH